MFELRATMWKPPAIKQSGSRFARRNFSQMTQNDIRVPSSTFGNEVALFPPVLLHVVVLDFVG